MKTTKETFVARLQREIGDLQNLWKRNRLKAIIVIALIIIGVLLYLRYPVITKKDVQSSVSVPQEKSLSKKSTQSESSKIEQHTEGNQSPAVNVAPGGTATVNYGSAKGGSTKQ
jgi:predicted negative regulator of RcsB-dependent stress response